MIVSCIVRPFWGRSPSWGAWIEMPLLYCMTYYTIVAPPRGERGLKSVLPARQSPRALVAPPRGERGLKFLSSVQKIVKIWSLPLVGSVD